MGHRMKAYPERFRQHLQRKSQQNATLESTVSRHFPLRSNQDPQHTMRTATAFQWLSTGLRRSFAVNSKSSTEEDKTKLAGVGENEKALSRTTMGQPHWPDGRSAGAGSTSQ